MKKPLSIAFKCVLFVCTSSVVVVVLLLNFEIEGVGLDFSNQA